VSGPPRVWVVYLPYLPLRDRATAGEWELIPKGDLRDGDCIDGRSFELARSLADLYGLPDAPRGAAGAFARPRAGGVGEDPERWEELRDLYRACVVAVIDVNDSPLLPEEERDPSAGHYALTSDNASVVAHGIDREGAFTGSVTGSRVPRQSLGISVLPGNQEELPRITFPPPADLRIPFGRTVLDTEYADATWQSIRRGDDAARRLGRAIDWLALAWLNLTALSDDIRIPALRAGFEVLLDSDSSDELAERLSQLLRDESPAVERWWVTRAGKPTSAELTDVAWWFTRFSFLRSDLMHGRSTGQPEWLHGDLYQTDLGEWYLREAIKHTVANDGHPAVVENLRWRTVERDARELLKRYREEPPEPG
jgi:hypothetical protein